MIVSRRCARPTSLTADVRLGLLAILAILRAASSTVLSCKNVTCGQSALPPENWTIRG